jgi:sulfate-transporting ATPase
MNSYLQFAILGLGAAAAYAMLAHGVVLIYRASGVINFAHGAYAMAGAYVFYELHDRGGMATVPALLLTLVFGTLLGLVSYWAVLRPLRTAPALTRIIATLGILTILQAAATLRYEQTVVRVESILPHSAVKVLGATVPQDRLWLLGIAVLITIALHLLSHRTRVGLATFAVSESEQAAAALGWSPTLIAAANW